MYTYIIYIIHVYTVYAYVEELDGLKMCTGLWHNNTYNTCIHMT